MKNRVHGAVAPRARAARHQEAEAAYREALDAHPSHPYALENLRFDEPVVAVEVVCPSTGEDYLLRVPPETRTCREAVAWTFSLPSYQYAPLLET